MINGNRAVARMEKMKTLILTCLYLFLSNAASGQDTSPTNHPTISPIQSVIFGFKTDYSCATNTGCSAGSVCTGRFVQGGCGRHGGGNYWSCGAAQPWFAPLNVEHITVKAYGASGGNLPGSISAIVPVRGNHTYWIYVGSQGAGIGCYCNDPCGPSQGCCDGGWNGGYSVYQLQGLTAWVTGSGGATDLREYIGNLSSRLVTAGGGGATTTCVGDVRSLGGPGGGLVGGAATACPNSIGIHPATGGTQKNGGQGGSSGDAGARGVNGTFGRGGVLGSNQAGAGGGGWYGGGSGSTYNSGGNGGAGGSNNACRTCKILENVQGDSTGEKSLTISSIQCQDGYKLVGSVACVPTASIAFEFTGMAQEWVVPQHAQSLVFHVFGAGGGCLLPAPTYTPGRGGYISASDLPVLPGQTLYIFVGGSGNEQSQAVKNNLQGWNGGAVLNGQGGSPYPPAGRASFGGGATDIRTTLDNSSRILVAGGGGGCGWGNSGGSGGPDVGEAGLKGAASTGGMGGSQTAGGGRGIYTLPDTINAQDGGLGFGGEGANEGGGGGGGYYGGGGGERGSGGGGGSNYASPRAKIIANERGANHYDGYVFITITECEGDFFPFGQGCVDTCPPGYYKEGKSCIPCGIGTYSNSSDQTSPSTCQTCDAGKFTSRVGSTSCTMCEPGKYSIYGNDLPLCDSCPPGKYQPTAGHSACLNCPNGYYNTDSGSIGPVQTVCNPCLAERFSATNCEPTCYGGIERIQNCMSGTATGDSGGGTCCKINVAPPPTVQPTPAPSGQPTGRPTSQPILIPTSIPTRQPTGQPSTEPSSYPTRNPTINFSRVITDPIVREVSFTSIFKAEAQTISIGNLGELDKRWYLEVQVYDTGFSSDSSLSVLMGTGTSQSSAVSQCSPPPADLNFKCAAPLTSTSVKSNAPATSTPLDPSGWYTCSPINVMVTSSLAQRQGGSLALTITPRGSIANTCSYNGDEILVRISLKGGYPFPTAAPIGSITYVLAETVMSTVMHGNTPYFILGGMSSIFLAFAFWLIHLRRHDSEVVQLPLLSFCLGLCLTGMSLASEGLLLAVLITSPVYKYQVLGILVLLGRLFHAIPSCLLFLRMYGPDSISQDYAKMVSTNQMLQHSLWYGALALITLLETSLFRFLPWRRTEFVFQSGGFPDMRMFRLCTWSKVLQSLLTVTCQFYFVLDINKNVQNASASSKIVFTLGLVSTFIMLLLSIYDVLMRTVMLKKVFLRMEESRDVELMRLSLAINPMALGSGKETMETLRMKLTAEQVKVQTLERRLETLERSRSQIIEENEPQLPASRLNLIADRIPPPAESRLRLSVAENEALAI